MTDARGIGCRLARRDAGITLLELVVALALFSMVAVMGLTALRGALRAQDVLEQADARTLQTAEALTLLRGDIEAMIPLTFAPPGGGPAEPALVDGGDFLALSIGGQPGLPGEQAPGLARVVWRHDPGAGLLTRQVWRTLRPADARAAGPEVVMLEGVSRLSTRVFLDDQGWLRGHGANGAAPAPAPGLAASPGMPRAVEVTLTSRRDGDLRILVVQ